VSLHPQVYEALGTVYDPELDEPITTLGFVGSCVVSGSDVSVRLRLPTPQCAPNFAFLMAADARRAVETVPGVGAVSVELEDHYTGREINGAVNRDEGFDGAFPGETAGDLDALRALFQRKALLARQSRLMNEPATTLGELSGPDADRCRALRRTLGIDASDDAPAFVTGDGTPVAASDVRFRRMASLTAVSLEANGGLCRDLLKTRMSRGTPDREEVAA
jgi:metal-sulfur cluster biosynthetic enzyme